MTCGPARPLRLACGSGTNQGGRRAKPRLTGGRNMGTWTRREMMAASALGAANLASGRGLAATVTGQDEKGRAREGRSAAGESIVLGFIGVGGMGTGLLDDLRRFP